MTTTILVYEHINEKNISSYIHNIETDICNFFNFNTGTLHYDQTNKKFVDGNLQSRAELFFDKDKVCKLAIKVYDFERLIPLKLLENITLNDVILVVTTQKVLLKEFYQDICHVEQVSSTQDFVSKLTSGITGNYDGSEISKSTIDQFQVEIIRPISGFTNQDVLNNFAEVNKEIKLL